MSGFPGPEGYSDTLARQIRDERERERCEALYRPPERSTDADTIVDEIDLKLRMFEGKRADMMTDRELGRLLGLLGRARHEIVELWNQKRKEGHDEAK